MKKFLLAVALIAIGVFGTLGYEHYVGGECTAPGSDSISPVDSSKAELPEIKSPVGNTADTAKNDTVK